MMPNKALEFAPALAGPVPDGLSDLVPVNWSPLLFRWIFPRLLGHCR